MFDISVHLILTLMEMPFEFLGKIRRVSPVLQAAPVFTHVKSFQSVPVFHLTI